MIRHRPRRARRVSWRVATLVATLGSLGACDACGGASSGPVAVTASPEPGPVEGNVTFGARRSLSEGLSSDETRMPARFVDVTLLDASGRPLASSSTDEYGHFAFPAHANAASVAVTAHIRHGGVDVATSSDARGEWSHSAVVPLAEISDNHGAIHFADTASEMAGALHITDTLLRGSRALERWTGQGLPPFFAYWGRGVTVEWSFFRGEVPEGSGRYCLELLGGPLGEQSTTDTDEHDEGIILHELGHYVMNRLAGDSSMGGRHPPGALVDPGVAWEEGRATWFAMAVIAEEEPDREPWYRDTLGIVPTGSTRIDEDVEHPSAPRGLGSERSVAGVLWDLTDSDVAVDDSANFAQDRDQDGVALGAARVLAEMSAAYEEPGSFVALPGFLRRLVRTGVVPEAQLRAMLAATGETDALLPATDTLPWPIELAPGTTVSGSIDGLSDPSPSGAPAKPDNGVDAVRVHRVLVPRAGTLVVVLDIEGTGAPADHTDLDLQLWTRRAQPIASADGPGARHELRRAVEPGAYVVVVRDAGSGNRASYRVSATLE